MDFTGEEYYGSSDHQYTTATSFTTKGRRTKRQRTVALSHGGIGENSYGSTASATPSSHTDDLQDATSEVTTEEEDMANCLILLAQGIQKKPSSHNKSKTSHFTTSNNNNINNINTNVTATSSTSVVGVYECKTCYKTFHSFQALGGHRTSHKKVKPPNTTTTTTAATVTASSIAATTILPPKVDDRHDHDSSRDHDLLVDDHDGVSHDSSPLPSQVINVNNNSNNNSNKRSSIGRVHECSICGSEFPSGQALGGHMRRHRAAAPVAVTAAATVDSDGVRNILSLDLNLPAPRDHEEVDDGGQDSHMVETKFHVLPTPALVDCHY